MFVFVCHRAIDIIGAYQVVYNCTANSSNSCFQDAPGSTNWIIGFKGGQTEQPEFAAQSTQVRAANATVEPRSLYWAQLVARVGDAQLVESRVGEAGRMSYLADSALHFW